MQAPDAAAYQEVIADCVRQADLSPLDVDGCDCYADGKILGDAVEASATAKAFRPDGMQSVDETAPLGIFASKGPTGNQIEACGLSSILKVLLSAQYGLMYPTLHLRILNPHVDLQICERPTFLAGEPMEYAMESCYVGITNRSLSGTNCHCLAWGQITDERIAPAPEPQWKRDKILFWPEGGGDLDAEKLPTRGYSIIGTWNEWQPQPMAQDGAGIWTCTVTLGVNRWERFQLLLDESRDRVLYPDFPGGGLDTKVCGPDAQDRSATWLLDARGASPAASSSAGGALAVASGSDGSVGLPGERYRITLQIKGKYRNVEWRRLFDEPRGAIELGSYYVVGTWSDWAPLRMEEDAANPGVFVATVTLQGGPGYFQLLRNGDWTQVLYPDSRSSADPSAGAVCGPDAGAAAAWYVYGSHRDVFRIEFQRSCSAEGVDEKRLSWQRVGR